jgi:hypothetical protein
VLADRLHAARNEFREALEAGLTPEEAATVRGGLERILANRARSRTGAFLRRAPPSARPAGRSGGPERRRRPRSSAGACPVSRASPSRHYAGLRPRPTRIVKPRFDSRSDIHEQTRDRGASAGGAPPGTTRSDHCFSHGPRPPRPDLFPSRFERAKFVMDCNGQCCPAESTIPR